MPGLRERSYQPEVANASDTTTDGEGPMPGGLVLHTVRAVRSAHLWGYGGPSIAA